MGEAVASSEEGMEVEEREEKGKKESSSTDGVRSERFLPRTVLRVLLVEADDSTRQIIATLLRKCSYIVSAVPDGLKAWETLKGRPHNIDLILTEVELPSISGYALLTLIMEHDICKNIPVIMMSSQDSISVVLKFMLKGAADFLIKPVRRNELRNLWQHVWRRQVEKSCQRTIVHVPEYTAVEQQKVEGASENIVASIHSSDYLDSTPKNKECSEKGSDGQSSYTTPYLEAETAYMQNMQGLTQLKCGSTSNLSNTEKQVEFMKLVKTSVMPKSEIGGLLIQYEPESASCNEGSKSTAFSWDNDHTCAKTVTRGADSGPECQSGHASNNVEVNYHTDDLSEPSSEALDLIGKFEHYPKDTCGTLSANDGRNKFSFIPELELSLSTFHRSCPKNEVTDERHILKHSNVSAFSRYSSRKASGPLFPTLTSNCTELKEDATTFHNELFNHLPESTVGTESCGDALNSQENMSTLSAGQSGQAEAELPGPQLGFIPVTGVKIDSFSAGYGQVFPPTQSSFPPVWSPKGQQKQSPFVVSSSLHSGSEIHNFEESYCPYEETIRHSAGQTVQEEDNNLESVELLRHGSPTPGLSGIGSLCSGIESKLNRDASENICNGSVGNATPAAAAVRTSVSKRANDDSFLIHGLGGTGSHCCSQREAALIKFRLKRKDRCYEKKVRYQSRKRLAEQRPRVKGQFVRRAN